MMEHTSATTAIPYALAFMAGLAGSGHCIGMCGGLVCGFFAKIGRRGMPVYAAYHAARLAVYAMIGLIAAALGAALVSTGKIGLAQGMLQIVAGLAVIFLGVEMSGYSPIRNTLGFAPIAWLRRQFIGATQKQPILGAAIGGAINGLMPCSMTLAMAVQASTAPSVAQGTLLLLAFGVGTLPSMLLASALFGKLGPRLRGGLVKLAALFVIALGISTLWQGIRFYLVMNKLV